MGRRIILLMFIRLNRYKYAIQSLLYSGKFLSYLYFDDFRAFNQAYCNIKSFSLPPTATTQADNRAEPICDTRGNARRCQVLSDASVSFDQTQTPTSQ
jgi:hypothetical protein